MGLTRITSDGITDATIATADLADQSVTLAKLPHGTSSNNGKFLRANNGADPTFETVNTDLSADSSPQLGGDLDVNDFNIKNGTAILDITTNQRFEFGVAGTTVVDINGNGVDFKAGNNTHADNVESRFGTGNDLKIYHNGTHSFIQDSGTGNLMLATSAFQVTNAAVSETMIYALPDGAVNLYYDNSKKFETTSSGVSVTGTLDVSNALNVTGLTTLSDSLLMGDGVQVKLGTGSDLRLYHDGTDSHIVNYTGIQYLQAAGQLVAQNTTGEKYFKAFPNGAVELYYDNSKKFETHSGGVNVTGSVNPTGNVALVDNSKVKLGTGDDLQIYHSSGVNYIDTANTTNLEVRAGSEYMASFKANSSVDLFYDNSKKFETTSAGATVSGALTLTSHLVLGNNDEIKLGSSSQMTIWHTGSDFNMYNNTGQLIISNASGTGVGEGAIVFKSGNNNTRWYIASDGHFYPASNNTFDIGTTSNRVRNVYTNDLHLSNEGFENDVDGTWGSYTIQEGEESLFLINKRNGKKYKFNLTEVS